MNASDRPSMETVLERYDKMQSEMFSALDAEIERRTWSRQPNDTTGMLRSGCANDEDPEGEKVGLPRMYFKGTYAVEQWHAATDVVAEVGRKYGFTDTTTVVDKDDDLEVAARDKYGAEYRFGMATNTIFSVETGCHRWDRTPSPSAG